MNKKETKQLLMLGVLMIIFIVAVRYSITTTKKKMARGKTAQPITFSGGVQDRTLYARLERETRDFKAERDPFRKAAEWTEDEATVLVLNGIAWDEINPSAMINNEILAVGDRVQGHLVVDIKEFSVILNDGKEQIELKIAP